MALDYVEYWKFSVQHGQYIVVFVTPRGSSMKEVWLEVSESVVDTKIRFIQMWSNM